MISQKGKEGVQKYKYYLCSKQGFRRALTNVNPNRKVKLTREGYNAMVGFKRIINGTFVLLDFMKAITFTCYSQKASHIKFK